MEKTVNKAAFSLEQFEFPFAKLDLKNLPRELILENNFRTKGIYDTSKGEFQLLFKYKAVNQTPKKNIVEVECIAIFRFNSELSFENIPEYFYQNSIAILFPYVRAFVSSITLQANVTPIVLDTLNLSLLKEELKENTVKK